MIPNFFRSRRAEQIIPAVLPKADSRVELSDPGEGDGRLSAFDLSLKHLHRLHLQEITTYNPLASATSRDVQGADLWDGVCCTWDQAACNLPLTGGIFRDSVHSLDY